MITLLNSKSVYLGCDMKKFNEIREYLDTNHIKYKSKVKNRQGQWSGIGSGTVRGRTGSIGTPAECMYEYEILVHKDDFDKVRL